MSYFGRKLSTKDQDIYITSDLHFFHGNVMKFCPDNRPYKSVEQMNQAIIDDWNSKVDDDDIIISLGDFSFKGKEATENVLSQLKGKKIFIYGNHDKVFRNGITRGKWGIEELCDYLELRVDGQKICMSHYPMTSWNQQMRGSMMFYGHVHNSFQGEGKCVDVGWDSWGEIINIKKAIEYCDLRPIYCPDHHKKVGEQ